MIDILSAQRERENKLKLRTPAIGCPACEARRLHTAADWTFHPYKGHGFTKECGWSHPDLAKLAGGKVAA